MVPLKLDWFTVHCVEDSEPNVGAALMVRENVPLTVVVVPLKAAVRPAGSPVAVRLLYAPVPPRTPMVPLKPDWFTVHWVEDNEPSVGATLMVMENVPLAVALVESLTLTLMLLK